MYNSQKIESRVAWNNLYEDYSGNNSGHRFAACRIGKSFTTSGLHTSKILHLGRWIYFRYNPRSWYENAKRKVRSILRDNSSGKPGGLRDGPDENKRPTHITGRIYICNEKKYAKIPDSTIENIKKGLYHGSAYDSTYRRIDKDNVCDEQRGFSFIHKKHIAIAASVLFLVSVVSCDETRWYVKDLFGLSLQELANLEYDNRGYFIRGKRNDFYS